MSESILYGLTITLPLVGGILALFSGKASGWYSTFFVGSGFFLSVFLIVTFSQPIECDFEWLPGWQLEWRVDVISAWLIALVYFISFMVHLFSIEYMKGDSRIDQYFAFLSLFTTSMIGLLIAGHIILLFIFWELVGFSSYLLIGFWYQENENSEASRIAFITNRVADAMLIAGIMLMLMEIGGSFNQLDNTLSPLASFLIVMGCFGKSAQFPFYHWLPRAMAGPTPVSALIHAATMVAAGIYLLVRISPYLHPIILDFTALIGGLSALMAGVAAMTQWDIKKVLAYSTISQLGYMTLAVGVGAREMALFHLWTHAFFKAGLFLAAGAIIHQMHHSFPDKNPQDMRNMGGLKTGSPIIFGVYIVCTLALVGLPFFSGFFTKEGIVAASFLWSSDGGWRWIVPIIALFTIVLTAFYMTRQVLMIFFEKPKNVKKASISWIFGVPLIALSLGTFWFFYNLNPLASDFVLVDQWFNANSNVAAFPIWLTPVSILLVVLGTLLGYERKKYATYVNERVRAFSFQAFYLDKIYQSYLLNGYQQIAHFVKSIDNRVLDPVIDKTGMFVVLTAKVMDIFDKVIVDGILNFISWIFRAIGDFVRLFHSRRVQLHLFWSVTGIILILIFLVLI